MKRMYIFVFLLLAIIQTGITQNAQGVVQQFMAGATGESGLKTADVSEWVITDVVPSLNPAIEHVYVQQKFQGIPVENGRYKLTVNNGRVTWSINQFVADIEEKSRGLHTSLTPEAAIMKVVQAHALPTPRALNGTSRNSNSMVYDNSGISLEPITVDKVYMQIKGKLTLGYKVSIYQLDGQHWWNEVVDGASGEIVFTDDWVISCSFDDPNNHSEHVHNDNTEVPFGPVMETAEVEESAFVGGGSYNVYPLGIESPNHGNRVIVNDPANAEASPFGWHDTNGQPGAEFTFTRGNNVFAQEDRNGNNGSGDRPDGGSSLDFNFPLNLNNNPASFIDAATTNLFYWNNIMHDVWYQYGFNESSGNFQENNYGNGGAGSDSVNADAQDGSGTNNANFGTPPDGGNPRMQMFLWTNPTRDGDFDNVIIAHEYGHGISTRLVGGPGTNALGGSEQMGEGWSDWFGLVMTIRPGDNRNTPRGVGTYAIGQSPSGSGIRPTRYSTNLAVNGTDYGDIGNLAVPHGVGYGFATILWDMTWDLIDLEGYDSDLYNGSGGNNIAMALVIEGLKNTANNPGYVSGRNGILQADQDLYGGQYNCLIWDAFARRGVGVDAVENSNGGFNSNTDQIISFTSGCTTPPPPASCNDTVSTFPYSEGFENTLGVWSQGTGDDLNWTINSGGTPSDGTGPSGADQGTFYIYLEASGEGAGFPNKTAILNSPCFDLSGTAEVTFSYQMTGNAVGSLRLESREDGSQTWTEIWSRSGDQGADWQNGSVNLSSNSEPVQLRFVGTSAASWQGDIAIDDFNMTVSSSNQPPNVSFNTPTNNTSFDALASVYVNVNASDSDGTISNVVLFLDGTPVRTENFAPYEWNASNQNDPELSDLPEGTYTLRAVATDNDGATGESTINIIVIDPSGGNDNIALGKPAVQSSTGFGGVASRAVDGNTSGIYNNGSITHTRSELGWWRVDLGDMYDITSIRVFNRTDDCCADRLENTAVYVGNIESSNPADYIRLADLTEVAVNSINNVGTAARYVMVRRDNIDYLSLAEVEVYGSLSNSACSIEDLDRTYNSFANQDNGNDELLNGNTVLRLSNNAWKSTPFDYTVTSSTVLQVDFRSTTQGEIHGIGFESDNELSSNLLFKLHGTQPFGIPNFDNYPNNGEWVTYTINVGDFYTGNANQLLFVADNDVSNSGDSFFRNLMVFEDFNGNGVCDVDDNAVINTFAGTTTPEPINGNNSVDEVVSLEFEIFPNPVTKGALSVSLVGAEAQELTIYNMLGQVLRQGSFENIVDVSDLSAGVYLMEIVVGDKKMNKRFIIKN